jgi:integrase
MRTFDEEQQEGKLIAKALPKILSRGGGPTVEDWLLAYSHLFPDERADSTREQSAAMCRPLRVKHGGMMLAEFTPLQAQEWALEHPAQVKYLRRPWAKAVLMGLAPVNVWKLVEVPRAKPSERRPPTLAELNRIVSSANRRGGWWCEFANLILVAAYTGARRGGVARLCWREVDIEGKRITLTEKGERARTVYLPTRAEMALRRQKAWPPRDALPEPDRRVFRERTGRPMRPAQITEAWAAARGDFPGPFHSLRHFAATWMAGRGVSEEDIAVQLGHTDRNGNPHTRSTRGYTHRDSEAALDRIRDAVT